MLVKPMFRNHICLNSHPAGCTQALKNQIAYIKEHIGNSDKPPRLALVVGSSTGYGLSGRLAAAFGYGAVTVGLSFERPGSEKKLGTPGFYNNLAFEAEAKKAGLISRNLDLDAFSNEAKDAAIKAIKSAAAEAGIPAKVDLFIYSDRKSVV